MIYTHTQLIGQPQERVDDNGAWYTAIYRTAIKGPLPLYERGLAGDQVADTKHHGSSHQAVCCHSLDHYAYWNAVYGLKAKDIAPTAAAVAPTAVAVAPTAALGPGSVGENWTVAGATEADICLGDVFLVGTARVQVSGPRYPCWKQERKLKLPDFQRRTLASLRSGWYLRVLSPGVTQAGDEWVLAERPYPALTIHQINVCGLQQFDPDLARQALAAPELAPTWRKILSRSLG
jgi:MOSC domain-containing protein YiiM